MSIPVGSMDKKQALRENADFIGKSLFEAHAILDEIVGVVPSSVGDSSPSAVPNPLCPQLEVQLQADCSLISGLCARLMELKNRF
jgi:hypothetical protein